MATLVTAQLLFLESENPKKEISFYINSPGGLVTSGLGIYDTMQYIKPAVSTLCIGQASSMGSFLLAAGEKGKRFSLPNSRIMIHQPSAGYQGQATDIEIHAKEILALKSRLNKIYAKHTKKNEDEIKKACKYFIKEGVTSIAVCLINSYANNDHEQKIEKLLRKFGFEGYISLSSVVSGEYREYERTTTTVIDSFAKARMSTYLNNLRNEL